MKRTTVKEPVYEFIIKAVLLAAILTMVPPPGLLGPAQAADVDWNVNMRTVNSDNFNRLPNGLEETGTQFTLTSGLDLAWTRGGSSYSVGGEAGSQWVYSNQETRNLVYRLNTDLQFNRSSNRYVNITANASRDTSIPEEDLLNRNRVREDRLTASIVTGATSSWEIGLRQEDIDSESAQSRSVRLNAQKTWKSGPGSDFKLSGSALRGDDKATDNIWREEEISAELTNSLSRRTTRGVNLSWSASKTETEAGGTLSRLDNLSFFYFRRSEVSTESRVGFSLGADGLSNVMDEGREWSGQAGFTFDSQLAKRLNFNLDSSASTRVFRNADRTPERSRTAQISVGLDLNLSRSRGVFTTASYGKDRFPRGTAGMPPGLKRQDERFFGQLEYREHPSQEFELSASLIVEKVNSNLLSADFEENRMELAASIMF